MWHETVESRDGKTATTFEKSWFKNLQMQATITVVVASDLVFKCTSSVLKSNQMEWNWSQVNQSHKSEQPTKFDLSQRDNFLHTRTHWHKHERSWSFKVASSCSFLKLLQLY